MERRWRQDDGPWNRPHYGSAHSGQPADYYHEASPQYQHAASRRTGPYTDLSHVPWDGRAHHQNASQQPYEQLGSQTYGGSERRLPGSMEPDTFHHGHPHSLADREAQPGMFPRGSDRVDGPQSGIPHMTNNEQRISQSIAPHMTSNEQNVFHHGGSHSGVPPHMTSTEERVSQHDGPLSDVPPRMANIEQRISQHGGPPSGVPLNRTSTDQRSLQHGNPQSAFPHRMAGFEQRIYQHGGPQSDIPSHMTSTEHGGPHSSIPPHMTSNEHRISQHDGPRSDVPPRTANIEHRISQHGGPPSDVPSNRSSTDQRASQHGNPQSAVPHHMVDIEQRISQHGGPHSVISPHMASTEHGGPHSDISPHMASTEHGGPHSDISPHMASTEHGGPHSSIPPHMAGTERKVSLPGGPHCGIPHHMARIEQRIPQHGGAHSDIHPHMPSIAQRVSPHGGPQSGIPHRMAGIEQRISQHGGPHSDFPTCMTNTDQRIFKHDVPQSGITPHIARIEQKVFQHGGSHSSVPPHMTTEHRVSQQGNPQSGITPHLVSTEQRISRHGGPQSDNTSHMARTEQRVFQQGDPHSYFPLHMTSTEQTVFQHDVPQSDNSSRVASTEQRTFHHGGPQSGISPHMASNEQRTFQHGGPQSGVLKHGPSQPRSIHFGGRQHEGQHSNELQLKGPGQEMFRMEDSQKQAWSFQNTPRSGEPGISSFGDSQPELFNPASLNRPSPNDVFHHRVPPPSIIQQSSTQLPPEPAQNIQHPNNSVQTLYSFPPPLHGPPLNPPTIPSFVCPPQMGAVFSGPPSEGIPEVTHIQIQDRSENTALFNPRGQDNHLHQEIRLGHKLDLFANSEVPGVPKNPFFSKNSFQVGEANFFHQDVPDILRDQHFKHQPILNEQHEKSLMNPNRQSEMLGGTQDPSDKDMFQRWLYNFLACRRNKVPPKPNPIQSVSIPKARNLIYGAMTLVSQLRSLCQCLENTKEEEPSWSQDYEKGKDIKVDLAKQLKELEEPGFIQCVKMKLDRVRKKRLRWQRRRQAKEEEKEAADRVAEREAEIDSWRMRCVQEVEEKKKERELKAAADSVLGEVRKKQADTKKMLDMLKSLEKLRKLRKEAAARKGVSPPPSADETFKNHISRLRSMVHKRITLYDAEERALRVILEGEQEEERQRDKDQRLRKQRARIFQKQRELDSILFGDDEPLPALHPLQPFRQYHLQAEQSVVSLVQIRHEWDRFLAPPDHPDASSIPHGWVLPMPPSSEIWATTLTQAE